MADDDHLCVGFQYFFDAAEAESWMSEQELYMMAEDRAKDEMGANNMLKKHGGLEKTVEDYAETIRLLGERSRTLLDEAHPDRYTYTRIHIHTRTHAETGTHTHTYTHTR